MTVKKAVVIGAGVMGAGIAAQLANAGIEVELLDIVPKDAEDRDVIAKNALQRLIKDKPAPFMHKKNAKLIRPGNIEDHLDRLGEADLIIEAVIENPKIKSDLFKKIDANRKPGSIVGSNTSTIPLEVLSDGQSEQMKKDMVITHFFNPPRYMPLLEIVSSNDNDKKRVADLADFMDRKMGKTVIHCKDTPGFIANRVGTYWLTAAMNEAMKLKLTPEQADAIAGKPMGVPKTGIFGLVDLVGLDLMPHISKSLLENVPPGDDYRNVHSDPELIQKMIKEGHTGRKGKGGFYRMNKQGGVKQLEVIDLYADEIKYSPVGKPKVEAGKRVKKGGLKELISHNDIEGQYAWNVLKKTLSYAASMVPEIHDDITAIDDAMKLGYNWKAGPFEMIDKIGVDHFIERLEAEGEAIPAMLEAARGKKFYKTENGALHSLKTDGTYKKVERPEGVLLLSDVKRGSKPVASNMHAKLWDIGDGVLCLEFTSPMNSLDPLVLSMVNKANKIISKGKKGYRALVVHNEGTHFSVGANIKLAEIASEYKQYWAIDKLVKYGQDTYKKLKYSPFPVVGAPSGMAVGGGCEILLHCDAVQAHAETYMGLVEMGVGIIPGWGGCVEMLGRAQENPKLPKGPMPAIAQTFETIAMAKVSPSAAEAKDLMYLKKTDSVTMNKARLLADAKAKAIELADNGYTPPKPRTFRLPGNAGRGALQLAVNDMYERGFVSSYAVAMADQLATVLTGGKKGDVTVELTEDEMLKLEREAFGRLARDPRTLQRIKHMLTKNKALDTNGEFLKEDRRVKDNVTTPEIRSTIKGGYDLQGRKYKNPSKVLKKLAPSFEAAKRILQGKKAAPKGPKGQKPKAT